MQRRRTGAGGGGGGGEGRHKARQLQGTCKVEMHISGAGGNGGSVSGMPTVYCLFDNRMQWSGRGRQGRGAGKRGARHMLDGNAQHGNDTECWDSNERSTEPGVLKPINPSTLGFPRQLVAGGLCHRGSHSKYAAVCKQTAPWGVVSLTEAHAH